MKFLSMAIVAIMLFSCSNQDENVIEGEAKSIQFSLDVAQLSTRASEATAEGNKTAVLAAINDVTLELYSNITATGTPTTTIELKSEELALLKGNEKVWIHNVLPSIKSVKARVNVLESDRDINTLQANSATPFPVTKMEYEGISSTFTLVSKPHSEDNNAVYEVIVPVTPTMARLEIGDVTMPSVNTSTPPNMPNGTLTDAQAHFDAATINAAVESAKEAWRAANNPATEPADGWSFIYDISFTGHTGYAVTAVEATYMNNIGATRANAAGGTLVMNVNNGLGNWDNTSAATYQTGGSLVNMWDQSPANSGEKLAYNLFPQKVNDNSDLGTTKSGMPHVIFKLTTNPPASPARWLTIRAFKNNSGGALITSFDAGKLYKFNLSDVQINAWISRLVVKANGTPGNPEEEDEDPTDPNPEPENVDLLIGVSIQDWVPVVMKPIF